jgi:phosphatidylglycerophosphate synthase
MSPVFGVSGLIAIYSILDGSYFLGWFIVLKSGIDAADGELARQKTPSYTGRYLDSVFDIILNFLF